MAMAVQLSAILHAAAQPRHEDEADRRLVRIDSVLPQTQQVVRDGRTRGVILPTVLQFGYQ